MGNLKLLSYPEKRNYLEEKFNQYLEGMYYDIKRNYEALRIIV
jgi:hypothetical protein